MKLWSQIVLVLSAILLAVSVGVKPEADHVKVVSVGFRRLLLGSLEWFGEIGKFCVRLARAAVTPPFEGKELLRQMDEVGAKSLPLVALAGSAIGVVLSLHTRDSLVQFGAKSLLPTVIVLSLVKESGPIITALVVSGRVGAGIGAELGSMRVTEQIDAMEVSAVNPYKFLVATRVLACMLMLPLLTAVADLCGILTGWVTNALTEPMPFKLFLNYGLKGADFGDMLPSTLKTVVFGFIIGVMGCFQGMRAKGGTAGVGRASTSAVVLASLFVILADVVLVRLIITLFPE
ncbi:MAG TPA: ABC transporter permease [Blastocatellia bacterium]|jgi:phospholipid/cholesterol/gamma-HCH transport system permease protein|nr:ABC transporter permease [Blastocatellia bacterium]